MIYHNIHEPTPIQRRVIGILEGYSGSGRYLPSNIVKKILKKELGILEDSVNSIITELEGTGGIRRTARGIMIVW